MWRYIGASALSCGGHLAASATGWKPHSLAGLKPGKSQPLPVPSVPSEIFPYLVVVIGLENVLVLTKSVVSTPVDLEVKLRIAQGNAGWWAGLSVYAQGEKELSKPAVQGCADGPAKCLLPRCEAPSSTPCRCKGLIK